MDINRKYNQEEEGAENFSPDETGAFVSFAALQAQAEASASASEISDSEKAASSFEEVLAVMSERDQRIANALRRLKSADATRLQEELGISSLAISLAIPRINKLGQTRGLGELCSSTFVGLGKPRIFHWEGP